MRRAEEVAFDQDAFASAVDRIASGRPSHPGMHSISDFIAQYRKDALAEDMAGLSMEDVAGLALDLWSFHREAPNQPTSRVRVRRAAAESRDLEIDVLEVVGPDMAFLVDSVIGACHELRLEIRAVMHPVIIGPNGARSLIQVYLPPLSPQQRAELKQLVEDTLADVRIVNADHQAMRMRMLEASANIDALAPTRERGGEQYREGREFLNWLVNEHFVLMGSRDYTYAREPNGDFAAEEPVMETQSGLGILRDPSRRVLSRIAEPAVITPAVRDFLNEPQPVMVAKASFRSRVHRNVYADYVGVKRFGPDGDVVGETRFVGLLASAAYNLPADEIPLLRQKIAHVQNRLADGSRYTARRLAAVLRSFPRDELFQISEDDLARIAFGVLHLQVRPRTRLFIRRDRFDRYVSALLFVPRDSFSSGLRARAHRMIADAYGGRTSAFYPSFDESPLARVHMIIGVPPGHPEPDEAQLDRDMQKLFETWEDALLKIAREKGDTASSAGRARFTAAYTEAFDPEEGFRDLADIAEMKPGQGLRVRVRSDKISATSFNLKIYHRGSALDLAEIVPVLERMGLRVRAEGAYPIRHGAPDGGDVFVHDITLDPTKAALPPDEKFELAFEAVWARDTENDGFNALVVALSVDWRAAALFRTLCRFRTQSGLDPSEAVQIATLCEHRDISLNLLNLFETRFDPRFIGDMAARRVASALIVTTITRDLESVTSLDADRVLRRLLHLILALQRTNFYLIDADRRCFRHISLKVASAEADPLPAPRPFREIFVWSPEVEGIHLRFGPVARGGLRWSDRRDDFRTEVLGLVKAQQVKNAVIVPVGSKGGFYPKALPVGASRDAIQAAGVSAYKTFVGALLQLTDNLVNGEAVRPQRLVTWDGDDPYLVVAADKGTATFSDIANEISLKSGFWLGDAFASGGSAGYDHKKMGITARGAWVAVQRHFRELGHDTQTQPFSVIGVGDMSGDVFGNGMLLSKAIRLIAAFDHRHVFLDPNPQNLEASWTERKRLFDLPRSSWADYDPKLISQGGGVFERTLKSIPLTREIRAITGLAADSTTPTELIHALLAAPCDLLWFGGIGAYVKASTQSHAEVSDKTNDALRVDAKDVKARVIGEGANLGVTQAGRIEFARRGGRINTDAIDNSAGVDTSDHEVNIKILLSEAIAAGELQADQRDALLASMTEEVARLVLKDNYDQTGALSVMEHTGGADLDNHERLIDQLEASGRLNRTVEGLPTSDAFRALRESGQGLTRPELAVLMAYAKLDLFDALVRSEAPDDPAFEILLESYFPKEVRDFHKAQARHRLRREIIATRLSNRMVNLTGAVFPAQMREDGADMGVLAQAFETAYAVLHFDDIFASIHALDGKVPAEAQTLMAVETSANLRMLTGAFLDDPRLSQGSVGAYINRYRSKVHEVRDILLSAVSPIVSTRVEARAELYKAAGAPNDVAHKVAMVRALASARETVDISEKTGWPLADAAFVQHQVGAQLGIDYLRAAARDLEPKDHWDQIALRRIAEDLPRQQGQLAELAIRHAASVGFTPGKVDREGARLIVETWIAPRKASADRIVQPVSAFQHAGKWSLAKLVLLGDALREFVYACKSSDEAPKTQS